MYGIYFSLYLVDIFEFAQIGHNFMLNQFFWKGYFKRMVTLKKLLTNALKRIVEKFL